MMEVLVIGLGSMGKRRIKLLREFGQVDHIIGIDKRGDRRDEVENKFGCKTYDNMETACQENKMVQCVFICTAPLSHNQLISKALNRGFHVFTELNLVSDGYIENMTLARKKGVILFLSSTHLYREEIRFIHNNVKDKKNLNYIYHIGQYLPDWHPWESFNDFFVGDRKTNGCREIMAIEFPWLIAAFGKIKNFYVASGNISKLNIPYKDHYMMQLEHERGNKGALIVDIVSPKAVRNLEIYGEKVYYCWDGSPVGLKYFDKNDRRTKSISLYTEIHQLDNYSSFVVENAYLNEIQEFFDVLEGKRKPLYGFQEDLEVLNYIDQIEEVCYG